jgi:FecR protein
MSTPSLSAFCSVLLSAATCALFAVPALADSQARIVRLSDVQGSVQLDKNTGLGFENAFLNLPVTQGAQLKTLQNGRAEIEFEDGSTMRLAPNSTVLFNTLGSSDSGQHVSEINLVEGMAYINWLGKDELTLNFSREKVSLDHAAHFRVDASTEVADLAVFKGNVEIEGPAAKLVVEKKKTATFDAADNDRSTLVNDIAAAPLDSWDKESINYHDQYAKNNSSPYAYGASDLNYYGSYSNIPGYGMMWQPYFTGIGWDPFMDGAWSWYPGYGYMFASAYPWGWMPYRYGNWIFVPGFGWMWQPGAWNSWVSVPRYTATRMVPIHPLVAPAEGTVKTVVVGKGGPVAAPSPAQFVVRSGSAGMGIPRGSLGNLSHLNRQVAKAGFVAVHSGSQFSASSGRSSGFSGGSSHTASTPAVHSAPAGHAAAGGHR